MKSVQESCSEGHLAPLMLLYSISGAGEMAQLVKTIAVKLDDPRSIPRVHMVEGEN